MQILRESFEATMLNIEDELNRNRYDNLEEDAKEIAYNQQWLFNNQEELSSTINLEEELSKIEISLMIKNENNEITIAGQKIKFKKIGKTLKPFLATVELKGPLKRKFIYAILKITDYKAVKIGGKPFLKYTFQYGTLAIDFFTDDVNKLSGFFKAKSTAKRNRETFFRAIDVNRYAYTQEDDEEIAILQDRVETLEAENLELQKQLESYQ